MCASSRSGKNWQTHHGRLHAQGGSSLEISIEPTTSRWSSLLDTTRNALPTASDVLGVVSLIFWALMAIVSLKYVVLILRADNDGEGGILALLSLVASERLSNGAGLPLLV